MRYNCAQLLYENSQIRNGNHGSLDLPLYIERILKVGRKLRNT
jgi:hypothetical protein